MTLDSPPVGGVLCAGFGTRMAPITDVIPKPLVPFLNTPMLAYSLDHLSRAGVTRVGMNLHHHADSIPPVADQLAGTMNLDPVYAREWEILGTAGGVRGIWNALGEPDQTLIVFNGDSVMNIDLLELLKTHHASESLATLVLRPKKKGEPGTVWVDEDTMKIEAIGDFQHPDASTATDEYTFTGVHLLEPDFLRRIPLEKGCMVRDIYGPLLEDGERVNAVVNTGFWAGIDSPALLFDTTCRVLEQPSIFDQVPMPDPLAEGLYVFRQSTIDDKTMMAGPLLTGPHVETSAGVHIGPNAVIDGVDMAEGASVRNAVIYGMGRLEGEWHNCLAVAGKVANLPGDHVESDVDEVAVEEVIAPADDDD